MWQRSIAPLPIDEIPGFEYEITFDVPEEKAQTISAELFRVFKNGIRHFTIDPYRNWMSEQSMIRLYMGNNLRLNLNGDTFKWVWKRSVSHSPSYKMRIKTSREEKGSERLITPKQISEFFTRYRLQGALTRHKRQFWIRDNDERIYKISVHRSSNFTTAQHVTRLDLEYVGRAKHGDSHNTLLKVTHQLQTAARIIKKSFPTLKPATSSLRAHSWIHPKDMNKHPALQILQGFKLSHLKNNDCSIFC